MSEVKDGGPAFPLALRRDPDGGDINSYWTQHPQPGMSLRDWFASQIAAGLVVGCAGMLDGEFGAYAKGPHNGAIANRAYALADKLLAERRQS